MNRTAIFLPLILAACATPNQVLQKPPVMEIESGQSVDVLEQCISLALSSTGNVSAIRGESRRTILVGGGGTAALTVTLIDGPPVRVEVRQALALNEKLRNRIRRCSSTGDWHG